MFVNAFFYLILDLFFDIHNLNLMNQLIRQQIISFHQIPLFQNILQIGIMQWHIGGNSIYQLMKISVFTDLLYHIPWILRMPHNKIII